MAILRAYYDNGNGTVSALPVGQCTATGQWYESRTQPGTKMVIQKSQAVAQGHPIISNPAQMPTAQTIVPVENQLGQVGLVRRETQTGPVAAPKNITVTFTNTSGGTVTPLVGDGNTIVVQSGRYAALPGAGFTIGGTFGTATLAMLRTFSANTPFRITNTRINYDNSAYLTTGAVTSLDADLDGNINSQNLNLQNWITPDQFQSLLVDSPQPFRLLLNPLTSLAFAIPDGRTVSVTFTYVSVAKAWDMMLVGNGNGN